MPSPYAKDERVLCFHHEILYEAKILDVRHQDSSDKKSPMEYKVHYKGWKSTWDDWVLEDRLRKWNDENRELANNIRRDAEAAQREKNSKASAKKRTASDNDSVRESEERGSTSGRGKRPRDNEIESAESFYARPSVRVYIPDNLKGLIVDDWERCTKNFTVVKLPAPEHLTVNAILDDYREFELANCESRLARQMLDTNILGFKEYFAKTVERILLYNIERPQKRLLKKKYHSVEGRSSPHLIWGAEHLVRLFSSLPELLAQTNLTTAQMGRMQENCNKILLFLSRNSEKYFRTEYIPAEKLSMSDV